MMRKYNSYCANYRTNVERMRDAGPNCVAIRLTFANVASGRNPRANNAPSAPEFAVLLIKDNQTTHAPRQHRDIAVYCRRSGAQRTHCVLLATDPAADPMHCVLLFPRGEQGWSPRIPLRGNAAGNESRLRRVTIREFYAFCLQARPGGAGGPISDRNWLSFAKSFVRWELQV